jgi:hypothetical protein
MHGEGFFEDAAGFAKDAFSRVAGGFTQDGFINQGIKDAANKVAHEFSDPESLLRKEVGDPNSLLRKTILPTDINEGIAKLQGVDWEQVKRDAENVLDPAKNGIGAAFESAGNDIIKLAQTVSEKMSMSAAESKAGLDRAFAPLLAAFAKDSQLSTAISDFVGKEIGTKEQWEAALKNPDTYFDILTGIIVVAAAVSTGPGVVPTAAAAQAIVSGLKVLTRAAQGKQLTAEDFASIATDILAPYTGGKFVGAGVLAGTKLSKNYLTLGAKALAGELGKRQAFNASTKLLVSLSEPGPLKTLLDNATNQAAVQEGEAQAPAAPAEPEVDAAPAADIAAPVIPLIPPHAEAAAPSRSQAVLPPEPIDDLERVPISRSAALSRSAARMAPPARRLPISGGIRRRNSGLVPHGFPSIIHESLGLDPSMSGAALAVRAARTSELDAVYGELEDTEEDSEAKKRREAEARRIGHRNDIIARLEYGVPS